MAAAFSARSITARLRRVCGVLVDFIGFSIPLVPIPHVSEGTIDAFKQRHPPGTPAADVFFRNIVPPLATLRAARTTAKSASGTSRNIKVIVYPRGRQAGMRRAYWEEGKVVSTAKSRSFATVLPSRRMSSHPAASGDSNAPPSR